MFSIASLEDLSLLRETLELECKLAQGQSGQGEVPKDFWPTYSAMANAHGGVVLLGVREKEGVFSIAGIANPAKVRADLFNNLNNPGKVSTNLLTDADVQELALEGQTILLVHIPQAARKQRPVFLNGQPLGHTYKRLNDGDRLCDEEAVKRMLAEQVEDERDARILPHFGMDDIDMDGLRIYRQMLKDEKPGHPYLEQDDFAFLQSLRGWRRDRATGAEGLTLAGLLMFGRWSAIQEAMPHYFLDYQERPEAKTELRWVDRLVPDGTWSGNLFEFYRRVYRKLVADLKVPFGLKDGQRQDDTPVHVALREALVNTLVHADYTGRVSVLVVKRPDMFGFRNPGGLRLPLEQVIRGGESDCRNRILHQMFLLIGLGERGLRHAQDFQWMAKPPLAPAAVARKGCSGADLAGIALAGPAARADIGRAASSFRYRLRAGGPFGAGNSGHGHDRGRGQPRAHDRDLHRSSTRLEPGAGPAGARRHAAVAGAVSGQGVPPAGLCPGFPGAGFRFWGQLR